MSLKVKAVLNVNTDGFSEVLLESVHFDLIKGSDKPEHKNYNENQIKPIDFYTDGDISARVFKIDDVEVIMAYNKTTNESFNPMIKSEDFAKCDVYKRTMPAFASHKTWAFKNKLVEDIQPM